MHYTPNTLIKKINSLNKLSTSSTSSTSSKSSTRSANSTSSTKLPKSSGFFSKFNPFAEQQKPLNRLPSASKFTVNPLYKPPENGVTTPNPILFSRIVNEASL